MTTSGEVAREVESRNAQTVAEAEARGRQRGGRRRRPTGAAPPLPRSLGRTGKRWTAALVVAVLAILLCLVSADARRLVDQADAAVLRFLATFRTPWLTSLARGLDRVATGWWMTFFALGVVVAQIVFRRWRHLFTFLAAILVTELVGVVLYQGFSRPRPYDVVIIGRWAGFSSPSPPAVIVSAVLVAVLYSLVPAGQARNRAKWVAGGVLAVIFGARLYLAVEHPFDVAVGLIIGTAFPLAAFRLFTPNEYVPVAYGRGKTAHLDVGGRRGEAIIRAVQDQLGLTVL
jgi:membrane-associated phospholipid phosphatase